MVFASLRALKDVELKVLLGHDLGCLSVIEALNMLLHEKLKGLNSRVKSRVIRIDCERPDLTRPAKSQGGVSLGFLLTGLYRGSWNQNVGKGALGQL